MWSPLGDEPHNRLKRLVIYCYPGWVPPSIPAPPQAINRSALAARQHPAKREPDTNTEACKSEPKSDDEINLPLGPVENGEVKQEVVKSEMVKSEAENPLAAMLGDYSEDDSEEGSNSSESSDADEPDTEVPYGTSFF